MMKPNKIVMPGGSGFIGHSFSAFAGKRGYRCLPLTRDPRGPDDLRWDGKTIGEWANSLEGAVAVVNLAGRRVNCVHNPENRREIIDSRVDAVRVVEEAIDNCDRPPAVMVQAGSLAIYGNTTEACTEDSPHGEDFTVDVCERWENEFFRVSHPKIRKCLLRIGLVLGANGGALGPLRTLTRGFLGGTVGNGRQYISWVHIDDLNRMIFACIEDSNLAGVFNATCPAPVTNRVFMKAMRKALGRPWSPPAPGPIVRFGARWMMGTDADLALTGRKCYPAKFDKNGFSFHHTDLDATLCAIMQEWDDRA